MDNEILRSSNSDDFLRRFIESYIFESLKIGSKQISLHEFEKIIMENVSENLHIPLELVLVLHRPFHWTFFNHAGIEPMFNFQQPVYRGEQTTVRLKRPYTQEEINSCKDFIFETYRDYLKTRIRNFEEN